ncbi:hypothetical protein GCM10023081_44570 [Arthrobacter ginkgonis]|uniref:Uncharacterized protein n=1 Tax=Arthrobacter ginkgonis TaxID=1630594 RepID=A0ABP7DEZ2_9MICC
MLALSGRIELGLMELLDRVGFHGPVPPHDQAPVACSVDVFGTQDECLGVAGRGDLVREGLPPSRRRLVKRVPLGRKPVGL